MNWRIDFEGGRIVADDPNQTVIVNSFGGSLSNPDVLRDARVIAVAPNLLNLARAARACIAETPPTKARVELVMVLDVVIAQALGSDK